MPQILKKHRKNLIAAFDFPEVRDIDRYVPIENENVLCNISLRYGFSSINHFNCPSCREDKPEHSFDGHSVCKKCRQ